MELDRIKSIAFDVRSRLVNEYGNHALPCLCAIASYSLFLDLLSEGFDPVFVLGTYVYQTDLGWSRYSDHCWVVVGNWIVDITATQFGEQEPVLLVPVNNLRFIPRQYGLDAMNAISEIWHPTQVPEDFLRMA